MTYAKASRKMLDKLTNVGRRAVAASSQQKYCARMHALLLCCPFLQSVITLYGELYEKTTTTAAAATATTAAARHQTLFNR